MCDKLSKKESENAKYWNQKSQSKLMRTLGYVQIDGQYVHASDMQDKLVNDINDNLRCDIDNNRMKLLTGLIRSIIGC